MENTLEGDSYCTELDELTGKQISIHLYKNIQNIEEIHKKLISKELPCCIVKATLVIDPFQIVVAANRAVLNEKYEQMVTKSLFTEVIFCLSISKNITQSLTTFGISNDSTNLLAVSIHAANEKESVEKIIFDTIKGEKIPISKLLDYSDTSLIKKIYKVNEDELKVTNLLDSVVSRISDKAAK